MAHYRRVVPLLRVSLALATAWGLAVSDAPLLDARDRPGPAPLPPAEIFIARARAKLISNEQLLVRYRYVEHSRELGTTVFGLGAAGDRTFEVFPHPVKRLTYRRLIREGTNPVPPARQAAQDRAYLATLEDYRRQLAREGRTETDVRRAWDLRLRAQAHAQAEELMRLFEFTLTGREMVDGMPAIVVAFAARPGAMASSRTTRAATKFRGRAWLHEFDHEIMRMESVAVEDVSIGWGLIARLHAGMRASLSRRRLPDGSWVPDRVHVTGTGHALLFRRVAIDDLREYSGFQPFDPAHVDDVLVPGGRPSPSDLGR